MAFRSDRSVLGCLEGLACRQFISVHVLDLSKASRLDGSDVSVGVWTFRRPHVLTVHTLPLAFWTFRRLYISTVHTFPLVAMSWRSCLEGSHFSVVILDLSKALHLDGSHFPLLFWKLTSRRF
jgi:hypothetical protein